MNVLRGSSLLLALLSVYTTMFSMTSSNHEIWPAYAPYVGDQEDENFDLFLEGYDSSNDRRPIANGDDRSNDDILIANNGDNPECDFGVLFSLCDRQPINNDSESIAPAHQETSPSLVKIAAQQAMADVVPSRVPDRSGVVPAKQFRLHPETIEKLRTFIKTITPGDSADETTLNCSSAGVCLALIAVANDSTNPANLLRSPKETDFYRTMERIGDCSAISFEMLKSESKTLLTSSYTQLPSHRREWYMLLSHLYRLPFVSLMDPEGTRRIPFADRIKTIYDEINSCEKWPTKKFADSVVTKRRKSNRKPRKSNKKTKSKQRMSSSRGPSSSPKTVALE